VLLPLLVVTVIAATFFPAFTQARDRARAVACMNQQREIGMAMRLYVADHDERYPPAASWQDGVSEYQEDPGPYRCGADRDTLPAYAFFRGASRKPSAAVTGTHPVTFESSLGVQNGSDLMESFEPRHPGAGGNELGHVLFGDGHVEALPTSEVGRAKGNR